jgi:NADPH:quinone reductase-like Zn-dependent oxidoreductase
MKAIVSRRYGPPDVLELRDVDTPVPNDDQLLVRIHAASVNPQDWHLVTGTPYIARPTFGWRTPNEPIPGTDLAGEVVVVGAKVTGFQPGDHVFTMRNGAFAEYVCVRGDRVVRKPANVTFEDAAAVPVAALTALQGLRDKGQIESGQRVLVNGASGGVGTFAVQIAKSFGAEVTGVCSARNVDIIRSIGADHVIDYGREDFTASGERYDLILDTVGTRSVADRKRILTPKGALVVIGGPKTNRWIGPIGSLVKILVAARFSSQRLTGMLAHNSIPDLEYLAGLLETGAVRPVIDRSYPLAEVPDALRYLGAGHAQGKVIIDVAR